MKKDFILSGLFIMITILTVGKTGAQESKPLTTAKSVDLNRYVGRWYEIAKIPNRFLKKCAYGTTAEYSLREDGRVDVVNSCYKANVKVKRTIINRN